ncbi:MAG: nascent polypeptide-associated complex protein [Candidatus Bathyarchaeota archaeon]|nr:nascent polypeptide-associated complex protein [Candidatus Bathyarchaeota archaeon]MDH5787778.1 nascent polypeptide-associated complex protein [Candidatus Bathyarchaeota archaeon]
MRRGVNPREARRMMQRMGMSMDTVENVKEVVIKTSDKEIVIAEPEVAILAVQGQKIFQVTGGRITEKAMERKAPTVPEEDIRLVADQTSKSLEEARKALEECGGDLAKAILLLQSKI